MKIFSRALSRNDFSVFMLLGCGFYFYYISRARGVYEFGVFINDEREMETSLEVIYFLRRVSCNHGHLNARHFAEITRFIREHTPRARHLGSAIN